MSEKEDWRKQVKEIVAETMREELKKSSPPSVSPPSSAEHEHRHWTAHDDIDDSCPECQKQKEIIAKDYIANLKKTRINEDLVCEGCGTGVKKEEESCPLCGQRKARKR